MFISAPHRRGARALRWSGMSLGVLTALAVAVGTALGQAPQPYGYLYLLRDDTLGVERVSTPGGSLSGNLQMRGQPRMEWMATLGGAGGVRGLLITAYRSAAADAPLMQRASLTFDGDTVRVEAAGANGTPSKQTIKSRADAFMLVNASAAMIDLALKRATATATAVDTIPVFLTAGGQTIDSYFRTWGDSASWKIGGSETLISLENGHVKEALVPAQGLRMRRVDGAAYAALKVGSPDYGAPAGAPYTAQRVVVPAGGHDLVGTLTLPSGAPGRLPAVVTITGSGGQDRDEYIPLVPGYRIFRQLADTLGRHGVAVLRYDDRGIGESGGSFAGSTSADFSDDVRAAVKWLRARPEIDPSRIFLVGHSEGGLIAPLVASTDPQLAGIVLLAGPGKNGLDIIHFQQRYAIEHDTSIAPSRRDSLIKAAAAEVDRLGKADKWMGYFFTYDPLATARKVKVPVLIAQGGSDQQVTAEQADVLAATLKGAGNRNVTVRVFPDHNHLFLVDPTGNPANYIKLTNGHIGPEVMGPVLDWILGQVRR